MGDRIVVMKDGRIEQVGSPLELYDHPANMFVAGFIGSPAMNFVPGDAAAAAAARRSSCSTTARSCRAPLGAGGSDGQPVVLGTRPEHLQLAERRRHRLATSSSSSRPAPTPSSPAATAGTDVAAVFRERHEFAPGSTIHLHARPRARASVRRRQRPAARRLSARSAPPSSTDDSRHDRRHPDERYHPSTAASSSKARPASPRSPASAPARAVRAAAVQAQTLTFKPEKGATLRVLRWSRFVQGDIDAYMANVKKFTDKTGIAGARRQRGLGRRAPEGGGGGQHRRRPRHHPVDQRRRQPLSRQAARRHRPRQVPRQEVRRLVSGRRAVQPARRQEVDRDPARRRRLDDGLPRRAC